MPLENVAKEVSTIIYVFPNVHEKPVTRRSDGKEFELRYQEGEIQREDHRPRVLEIGLREGDPPCAEGPHTIAAESFRPDQYDRLDNVLSDPDSTG